MSRHFFDCEMRCKVRVHVGHRSVSKEYFLEVERIGPEAGQEFLYDSGEDSSHRRNDLGGFRQVLKRFGLVVPESIFRAVQEDAARGLSTRHAQHFADGRVREITRY